MEPIELVRQAVHAPLNLRRRILACLPGLMGLIGLVGLPMLPNLAQAQIFMCKDANGRTLTSDRPIPECADRPVKELNKQGMVKREIPRPLTAQEQREKKEAEEKRKEDEANAIEQRRRNAALLQTYKNEEQIMLEQKRTLIQLQNNVNIALTEKNSAEQKRKVAQTEADELEKKGGRVPTVLKNRIEDANRVMQMEQKNADAYTAEMAKEKNKYEDILARYRSAAGTAGASQTHENVKK